MLRFLLFQFYRTACSSHDFSFARVYLLLSHLRPEHKRFVNQVRDLQVITQPGSQTQTLRFTVPGLDSSLPMLVDQPYVPWSQASIGSFEPTTFPSWHKRSVAA